MPKTDQKVLTEGVTLDAVFPTLDWFAADDCSFFTVVTYFHSCADYGRRVIDLIRDDLKRVAPKEYASFGLSKGLVDWY